MDKLNPYMIGKEFNEIVIDGVTYILFKKSSTGDYHCPYQHQHSTNSQPIKQNQKLCQIDSNAYKVLQAQMTNLNLNSASQPKHNDSVVYTDASMKDYDHLKDNVDVYLRKSTANQKSGFFGLQKSHSGWSKATEENKL